MAAPRQRKPTAAEMTEDPDYGTAPESEEVVIAEPFVLDLMAEVEEIETFPVVLGDLTIDFPLGSGWSIQVIEAFTDGRVMDAFTGMGFSEQELAALGKINGKQLTKLIVHVNKLSGDSLGEEEDSAPSSRSSGTKSKRTSSRSTASTSAITSVRRSARAS